jgi:hypothetical protein
MTQNCKYDFFLGVVTALLALFIAYRQYKNDKYRINIDLFDRRYEVYFSLGEILGTLLIHGLPHDDPDGFKIASEIGRCDRISKFLFPSNVQNEIKNICDESMRMMELYRKLKPSEKGGLSRGKERDEIAVEKRKVSKFLRSKLMNLESTFKKSQMNLTK